MPSAVAACLESCPMRGISMADPTETIRPNMAQLRTASLPIGSMYAIYIHMVTFTINIPQMLAYIPYMDPNGLLRLKLQRDSPSK